MENTIRVCMYRDQARQSVGLDLGHNTNAYHAGYFMYHTLPQFLSNYPTGYQLFSKHRFR